MSDRALNAARFASMPLIAILRGQPNCFVEPVVEALIDGGFTALEITMNSPGASPKSAPPSPTRKAA